MPATLEADLETLAPPGDPDDFVVIEDRPIWHEHWTREGRDENGDLETESVYMGEPELEQVARNCNERIRQTGDFSPFVINHTKDDGSVDPEVIGFVGPMFVGKFGKDKPKAAIYARKIWVFKQDYEKLKKFPRVSVEYWSTKSDPTNGVLDPVAALGASTPELDLGIRYSRNDAGVQVMRYSKVSRFSAESAPGGSNTYVPDGGCDDEPAKKKKTNYEAGGDGAMLSAAALQQILEAFTPVIEAKFQELASSLAPQSPPITDPNALPEEPVEPMPGEMGAEGTAPGPGLEDELPPEGESEGNDDPTDPVDDEEEQAKKYSAEHGSMFKDHASDSLKEPQAVVEGVMDAADDLKKQVTKYQRERDDNLRKFQKEVADHGVTKENYAKLQKENDGFRRDKMRAERYAKILERKTVDGVCLDESEEIKEVMGEYEGGQPMTDAQFDRHMQRYEKYSRVPLNRSLPQDKPQRHDGTPDNEKRERYTKQAIEGVAAARRKGESTTFEIELNKAMAADKTVAA
jgi:hypothetical protein